MGLVLIVSTWSFVSFILDTRPEDGVAAESALLEPLSSLARLPASLPAKLPEVFAAPEKIVEPIRMDTLKLSCWDTHGAKPATALRVNARWLRLVGRACAIRVDVDHVSVRNLRNGYAATLFTAGRDLWTTDFIPLEDGNNEVVFRFERAPGVAQETRVLVAR